MLASNLGHALDHRVFPHDHDAFARAEPDTMRYWLYHLPASPPMPTVAGYGSNAPRPGPTC
ncbi:hypothetical protein [Kitasatospora aureofaciens]|uniref:hypothetical protein n=1 Tax=Kitasatospora aureofaciens TaxID=1894 RepID=UPI0036F4AC5A